MDYLAIDIGGTTVKIGLLNIYGEVLYSDKYSVSFDNYETPIMDTVCKSVDKFLLKNKIKDFESIVVSATGQIDVDKGKVIGTGGNIKNYEGYNIKDILIKKYNKKVSVINDANAAVLGEVFVGEARGYKNVLMITIGTGVGGGVIVNGEILNGRCGIGGEIGHFSINNRGKVCTCNNVGCYEQYASMTALIKTIKEKLNLNINGKEIFDRCKTNKEIYQIVDNWIDDIVCGIVSLVHIFNPEIVLIGGAVSEQKELFIDKVREKVLLKAMKNFSLELKLQKADLGNDAGLVGALYYYLKDGDKDEI